MRPLQLQSHSNAYLPLSAQAMAAAEVHAENKVFSMGERIGDQVQLEVKGKVAFLQLGEQRLEIAARHMSWQTLVDLACAHRKVKLNALNVASEQVEDLIKALSQAFLSGLSRLFQRGLRRDYQSQVQPSEILRGDILFSRWFGPKSPGGGMRPPCRFRTREIDIVEHRAFYACLKTLSRHPVLSQPTRSRAHGLLRRLSGVGGEFKLREFKNCRRTGLFKAYAEPLALAEIILEGMLGLAVGQRASRGFVLDIDKLFEAHVVACIRAWKPAGWQVKAQASFYLDEGRKLNRLMDCALYDESGRLQLIIDAKNKNLSEKNPSPADIHQIHSYMASQGCKRGALVGLGASANRQVKTHRFQGGFGDLDVVALPGRLGLAALNAEFKGWFLGRFLGA